MRADEDFYQRLAVHAKVPYASLEPGPNGDPVDPDAARTIGAAPARPYSLVPIVFDASGSSSRRAPPKASYEPRKFARPDPPPPSRAERRRAELLARHAGLEFVELELQPDGEDPVDHEAARAFPEEVCRAYKVLPVAREIGRLVVAVDDPFDAERERLVFALTAKYPRVCVAAPRELQRAIARVFGRMA